MSNLHRESLSANPCPDHGCSVCDDASAEALAAQLGLADDLDLADEAADRVVFQQVDCLFIRPRDEDAPADLEATWEDVGDADREWWAQLNEEGAGADDLSPFEEWIELCDTSFERACQLHAALMEEEEQEALYNQLVSQLGGFHADL